MEVEGSSEACDVKTSAEDCNVDEGVYLRVFA